MPGTIEAFCRVAAKHAGKLVVTSCQAQFGPAMSGARTVNLTTEIVKASGVALKLLLAEAGLVLPESPDHEITLGIDPGLLVRTSRRCQCLCAVLASHHNGDVFST